MHHFHKLSSLFLLLGMLLGIKDGCLALWKEEDPQPVTIFPVRICSLPPADQTLLRQGIPVKNTQALLFLLEDYL